MNMIKLLAAIGLVLGVAACDQSDVPEEEELETIEQNFCQTSCPSGSTFVEYSWQCTGQTSAACPGGVEREYALCNGDFGYVWGTTTCRTRCGCGLAVN
jgi:hypothetical protein